MSIFGWTIPLNISLIPVSHSIAKHASLESVFTLLYYSCMHLYHMSVSALPLAAATLRQCSTVWSPALIENEWFPDALTQVAVTLKVPFRLAGFHTNTCAFAKLFCNSPGALPPVYFCLLLFEVKISRNTWSAVHLQVCKRGETPFWDSVSAEPSVLFQQRTENSNGRSRDNWQRSEPILSHLTHIHTRRLTPTRSLAKQHLVLTATH